MAWSQWRACQTKYAYLQYTCPAGGPAWPAVAESPLGVLPRRRAHRVQQAIVAWGPTIVHASPLGTVDKAICGLEQYSLPKKIYNTFTNADTTCLAARIFDVNSKKAYLQ
jgi:hypothetical protein